MVWRHGRTEWNLQGRHQGQLDIPLDEVGVAQAERAARLLAGLGPDTIISSDLQRAVDTAAPLARITGLSVTTHQALRETYAGEWQGLTNDEIDRRYPEEVRALRNGEQVRRGGGETEAEVAERMAEVITKTVEQLPPESTMVVVTHGGAGRMAIAAMMGLPVTNWHALGGLSNCSWSILGESRTGWRLLEHNAGSLPEPVLSDDL